MASHTTPAHQVSALSDLSAALLVRGAVVHDVRDVLEAIETADSALRIDPASPEARFNLALALEMAGLSSQASAEWAKYLTADTVSGWSMEARNQLNHLKKLSVPVPAFPSSTSETALVVFVNSAPQSARIYGWNDVLGNWGNAVVAGDKGLADDALNIARQLGRSLEAIEGDPTISDAVRSIEAVKKDAKRTRALASAHIAYSLGQQLFQKGNRKGSTHYFADAIARSSDSNALNAWARLFYAAALVYDGNTDAGREVAERVRASAPSTWCAVKGRADWTLATTELRLGHYESSRDQYLQASAHFSSCGEAENAGVTRALAADAQFNLGDATDGYVTSIEALRMLRRYHNTLWVHNLLAVVAAAAATDGFPRAAFRIQSEGLSAATGFGNPIYIAEAHLARARLATNGASRDSLGVDLGAANSIIDRMVVQDTREWFAADLFLTRALTAVPGRRAAYHIRLDSAVSTFQARKSNPKLLPALLARADAALEGNDLVAAQLDLSRAMALLESEQESARDAALRTSIMSSAHKVFSQAAAIAASRGDTVGALKFFERGRASLTPFREKSKRVRKTLPTLPKGVVALEYMMSSDTLFVWAIGHEGVRLVREPLLGFAIVDSVTRLINVLSTDPSERAAGGLLVSLYSRLISPISDLIRPDDRLVFLGDAWVSSVPFGALKKYTSSSYLIEGHSIGYANHLRSTTFVNSYVAPARVLLIGDPAFDAKAHPGVERLPSSLVEVDSLGMLYRNVSTLTSSRATPAAVMAQMQRASLIHYAGHAVIDPVRPLKSYLLLARDSEATSRSTFTAEIIQRAHLSSSPLVVLSACETARPSLSAAIQMNGLALAFLAAGATGVVGSLWPVEDRETLSLMLAFHRELQAKREVETALQGAQLTAIKASRASQRKNLSWAAFQYVIH